MFIERMVALTQNINLKVLERKAYLSYHQDGLIDSFIGLFVLIFGIGMAFDISYIGGVLPPLGIALYAAAKRIITIPRIGLVRFGPERTLRMKKEKKFFQIFFSITVLLGVLLFFGVAGRQNIVITIMRKFVMAPIGIIGAVGFAFLGYWKQISRYYIYAGLILITVFVGPLLKISHPAYFSFLGIMMLIPGLCILTQFIRKYPLPAEEV